jgi:hypothetical protein
MQVKNKKKSNTKMETIRLNKSEQELIAKKTLEINKIRVLNGIEPISKSDMVHILIAASISKVCCDKFGEVLIN